MSASDLPLFFAGVNIGFEFPNIAARYRSKYHNQLLRCWTERSDANANTMSRYWDVEIHSEEYSYVDSALRHGYSILTYDRLGTGILPKPTPTKSCKSLWRSRFSEA